MKRNRWIIFMLLFLLFPCIVWANSAEPPALIVLISGAPEDISVSVTDDVGEKQGQKKQIAWETYYAFYGSHLKVSGDLLLHVSGQGRSYTLTVDKTLQNSYQKIVTLDFEKQTLAAGKLLSRSILLVALRVTLTLVIEGAIFYLFGFRSKRSWICFFVINLITQGALNIVLNGTSPYAGYALIGLFFMEVLVFVAEIIAFLFVSKEKKRGRTALYVFTANAASLVLGGYLITLLPV